MNSPTSHDLDAYRSGDPEGLTRLFERHYQRVIRIVRSRLGFPLRKRADVGDLVQEVFIDALTGIESFEYRGEGSFANWIAVLAMRRVQRGFAREMAGIRDVRREKAMESMAQQFASNSLQFDLPADELSVSSKANREEMVERIEGAMQTMSEEHREVIRLRDYASCTFMEIAEIMGLSNETAASRLYVKATLALGKAL